MTAESPTTTSTVESPRAPGGTSALGMWVSTALTAVAFAGLHAAGLLGNIPLPLLLTLLVGSGFLGEWSMRRVGTVTSAAQLHAYVFVQVAAVTVIIYAIGWGPTLAIGYVFVAERLIQQAGPRTWSIAVLWSALAIACGQLAIWWGVVPTAISEPSVHGFALLAFLGSAFVIQLLGSKAARQLESDAQLRDGEASFRRLFADNPQPMWLFDAQTRRFIEANGAAVRHYGYARAELLAMRVDDVLAPDESQRLAAEAPAGVAVEQRHVLKDGRIVDVELTAHPVLFDGHDAVLVAIQDVTARNALEYELRHQAFHDALTGLANRALFADRVEHALRRLGRDPTTAALVVLDLDGFKTVNDSLGHAVGDDLLVRVAERLEQVLRSSDTAARLGGDEFAILLEPLATDDDAFAVAERLMSALDEPFRIDEIDVYAHASAGIAFAVTHGVDADELLRNADAAMYAAKAAGKGRFVVFEPSMHSAAVARLELEAELRHAIEQRHLLVHYQPIVNLRTEDVRGFEALVRWNHPTRGLLAPSVFIALAEELGLITMIGRFVLDVACADTQRWRREYPDAEFEISVNVSPRQLADDALVDDVRRALATSGLPPRALTLEITESVFIDDTRAAIEKLDELRAIGVRIAIDDFGTGYSSLGSLHALPIDAVKIDKSFIDELGTRADSPELVMAIVRLARTLGLETVAEGVEREDQLMELGRLGCDHAQGFTLYRPTSPEHISTMLADRASAAAAPKG